MEYGFYIIVGGLILLVIAGAYVWQNGLLGTATEARIKKLRDAAKAQWDHWEQELKDKAAANKAKEDSKVPVLHQSIDKLDMVRAWKGMLDSGTITQAQFEKQRDEIMKE